MAAPRARRTTDRPVVHTVSASYGPNLETVVPDLEYESAEEAARVAASILSAAEHRQTVRIPMGRYDTGTFSVDGEMVIDLAGVGRTYVTVGQSRGTGGAPNFKR